MAASREPRVHQMANQAVRVYRYLNTHPGLDEQEVVKQLGITRAELYRQLKTLRSAPEICKRGYYNILHNGKRLKNSEVDTFLEERSGRKNGPPPLERIIYLYHKLFIHTASGGMDMNEMRTMYRELMADYGANPSDEALKRMIYRDLEALSELQIALQRPSRQQPRYALMNLYLPKLKREHTILMYLGTLMFSDTLMDEPAACIRRQIEKVTWNRMVDEAGLLKKRIRVLGDTLVNPEAFGGCLEQLLTGILNCQMVEFDYIKLDGSNSKRFLAPLGLVCKRGIWYLVAGQRNGQRRRTFRVDQISRVRAGSETFTYPLDFDLSKYLGSSWGIMNDDQAGRVLIRFAPGVAKRLFIMRYHPSQKIVGQEDDGSLLVSYETSGFVEMKSWLMQWGSSAEVLEPAILRQRMKETAEELVRLYAD